MDSDWDSFAKALNSIIDDKLFPIEQQLNFQQEFLSKLRGNIESLAETLKKYSGKHSDKSLAKNITHVKGESKSTEKGSDDTEETKENEVKDTFQS